MDFLGWIWWAMTKLVGLVWSIGWFLLGGWVVTLAQIGVIAFVVYGYKYGWRRAPLEIARHARTFGSFIWAWMRSRDMTAAVAGAKAGRSEVREVIRTVRRKEMGDVNVSTLLSVLALVGLGLVALA
jgi:hypothetical protein